MTDNSDKITLINIVFVISVVIANVVGCKVVYTGLQLGGLELILGGGAITYAFTFLCTDIIGEMWGKEEAKKTVTRGFIGQVFALVLILLTQYTPTTDTSMQAAYEKLLGQSPMFVFGSLCAYWCGQKIDVIIFHKVRETIVNKTGNNKHRWIWNNTSTCISQFIDTSVYALIAFGCGMGWLFEEGGLNKVAGIIIGQYSLKVCLAVLDTPLFYLLTKNKA